MSYPSTQVAAPWWQKLAILLLQLAGFIVLMILHVTILEQIIHGLFPFMETSMEDDIFSFIVVWSIGLISAFNSAFLLDYFQQRLGLAALGFTSNNLSYGIRTGLLVGTGIIVSSFLILLAGGWVEILATTLHFPSLLAWLLFFLIQPLTEEVVMRSVLQTQVHRFFGRHAGLFITAFIFAFIHADNDAFSWVAGLEIFLGGYLMGLLYLKAQNIWAPFLMHASWNFVQSTVLGFAVSGMDTYRLLHLNLNGPEWLTGGEFGLEASWITVLLLVLAIVYYWNTPSTIPWLTVAQAKESEKNLAEQV